MFGYLEGYRVAVELRHRDWVTGGQRAETEKYFQERYITFVSVDAPHRVHFMIMPDLDLVTNPGLAYLRLHGRNATGFVSGRSVAERFDYKYSPEELSVIAHRVVNLADAAAEVHVVYNNNTSNYAPRDASELKDILADAHPEIDTGAHPLVEAAPARTMEMDLGDIPKRSSRAKLQTAKK